MVKIPLTDWLRGMLSDLLMKKMVWTDWWMEMLRDVLQQKNHLRLYLKVVEKLKLPQRDVWRQKICCYYNYHWHCAG